MRHAFPPGPRLPAMLQALQVAREPIDWMVDRWRRYGDCFSSRFPFFGRVVYVADPEEAKQVLTGDPTLFHAGEANAAPLGPVLGAYSLLTLDEDEHLSQRKLLLPPFHGENVRSYAELVAEIAEREVETWPLDQPFRLRERMQNITLEVILRAVFGVREEERLRLFRERIPRLAETSNVLIWFPFLRRPLWGVGPGARFVRARAAVDELIYQEIASRRADADAEERGDVLSLLLSARHDDGSPMTDAELRDELMTLLTAGHETTATGLSWAFERLMRTPAALERAQSELADDYLEAVVKETLRVRPVITDVARKLTRDTDVMGYRVPAGTLVLPAIAVLHRLPHVYPEPWAFRPERFLDGQPEPYTWVPFGGGIRRCIGASFAQMEMKTVLRTVLARSRLRAEDPKPEQPRVRHVTIVPSRGARAVLEERRPAGGLASEGWRSSPRRAPTASGTS
jgi:cytochrome P450 family 135